MDFIKNKFDELKTRKASKRVVALIIAAALSGLGLSSDLAKEVGTEISQMVEF
jgi:transketolase